MTVLQRNKVKEKRVLIKIAKFKSSVKKVSDYTLKKWKRETSFLRKVLRVKQVHPAKMIKVLKKIKVN